MVSKRRERAGESETTGTFRLVHVMASPLTAWNFLRGQLAYMREAGFDVTVVGPPSSKLDETAAREGVRAFCLPMERAPSPARDLIALGRLVHVFRRIRPHVVHVSNPKAGLLGGVAARAARIPIRVYTLRGLRAEGLDGAGRRLLLTLERTACRSAQRVFCVSESLRRRALELSLAPPGKLVVLGSGSSNGVDARRLERTRQMGKRVRSLREGLALPEGTPVVGFVGRLVRDKGIVELIEAFSKLGQGLHDLRLLLVGLREDYHALPRRTRAVLENDPRVVSTGFIEDTVAVYALMDILVLPTYREGFPNVLLEAAAMELPVVATCVTGCVDAVVDGVTGTLVPPRDPEALAKAIRAYLDNPDLRRGHGRAGRERVLHEFRPERIWKALHDEYVRLLRWKGFSGG